MKTGFFILLAFATAWGEGAVLTAGLPVALLGLPLLVSGALAFYGGGKFPSATPAGERRKIRNLVRLWSTVEGFAIVAAVLALGRIGRPAYIVPAIAVIVGLHFIPLARAIPQPRYYATAGALVVGGLIAGLLPGQAGPVVASTTAAIALWTTAVSVLAAARYRAAVTA